MRNFGNFIPEMYGDDGQISQDYLDWLDYEENAATYYEEQWERERDDEISRKGGGDA